MRVIDAFKKENTNQHGQPYIQNLSEVIKALGVTEEFVIELGDKAPLFVAMRLAEIALIDNGGE